MNTQPPVSMTQIARERSRRRRTGAIAALVVAVALIAGIVVFIASRSSGSASPGVAHVGPTPTVSSQSQSSSQSGSTQTKAAAYSACMRSHGVPSFPDPDSQGHLFLKMVKGSALDPTAPQFQAAQQSCKSLAPSQNTAATNAQFMSQGLKLSACMRSHGVPNFPDPKPANGGSGFMITGINPNSPQFQSAQQACRSLMPGGGPGSGQ